MRGAPDRPDRPVRDAFPQDGIGGQTDGAEIVRLFHPQVDRGAGIGRIGPKEAPDVAHGIAGNYGVEHTLPAVGAVDVAVTHGAGFQHTELVEHDERTWGTQVCQWNCRMRVKSTAFPGWCRPPLLFCYSATPRFRDQGGFTPP
jgi:hypothetical protein